MIKAIIADDEKSSRAYLESILKDEFSKLITIVAISESVSQAIKDINEHQPDIVFLDIEMPPNNGFDVLEATLDINYEVIFTTGFNQYAIKAIKYAALDYLLKPIEVQELKNTIDRYQLKKTGSNSSSSANVKSHKRVLLDNMSATNSNLKKLILPTADGMEFINLSELVRCESNNNYTLFHTETSDQRKIIVSKPLKYYQDLLSDQGFYRIHQSHLINLNFIKKYLAEDGGYVVTKDGNKIPVANRKKKEFMELFTNVN